jgi:hypothetical protein
MGTHAPFGAADWSDGVLAVRRLENGRVTLPPEVRAALGLLPRDPLMFRQEGDHLVASRATPLPAAVAPVRARLAPLLWLRRPGELMGD